MRCGRVRLTLFFPLHNSNFLYQIENVVCYPFRTANLVDNGTKEGQIGEGCEVGQLDDTRGTSESEDEVPLRVVRVQHSHCPTVVEFFTYVAFHENKNVPSLNL